MKARVKATGEIFEIASYATIPMECCDSFGNPLSFSFDEVEILSEENDLKESKAPDYWTRLEHQYAGMAMQGMLSNTTLITVLFDATKDHDELLKEVIICSHEYAHALVEKMKENEKAMH